MTWQNRVRSCQGEGSPLTPTNRPARARTKNRQKARTTPKTTGRPKRAPSSAAASFYQDPFHNPAFYTRRCWYQDASSRPFWDKYAGNKKILNHGAPAVPLSSRTPAPAAVCGRRESGHPPPPSVIPSSLSFLRKQETSVVVVGSCSRAISWRHLPAWLRCLSEASCRTVGRISVA